MAETVSGKTDLQVGEMSGFCSAHKHHEPGCKQCEAGYKRPCCPICGSEHYEGIHDGVYVMHYVCSACSVMFRDPDKFMRDHSEGK